MKLAQRGKLTKALTKRGEKEKPFNSGLLPPKEPAISTQELTTEGNRVTRFSPWNRMPGTFCF